MKGSHFIRQIPNKTNPSKNTFALITIKFHSVYCICPQLFSSLYMIPHSLSPWEHLPEPVIGKQQKSPMFMSIMRILNKTIPRNHTWGVPLRTSRQPIIWPGWSNAGIGAKRGCRISIHWDIQNSTWHGPEQHDLTLKVTLLWAQGWTRDPQRSFLTQRTICFYLPL